LFCLKGLYIFIYSKDKNLKGEMNNAISLLFVVPLLIVVVVVLLD